MAKILVFAGDVNQINSTLLSHLSSHSLEIIAFGEPDQECLSNFKQYDVKRVHVIEPVCADEMSPSIYTKTLYQFISTHDFDYVFTDTSPLATEVFPYLSAMFDSALVTGAIDFSCNDEALVATKMIYGGDCLVDVEMMGDKPWFITVEVNALDSTKERELEGKEAGLDGKLDVVTFSASDDEQALKPTAIKQSHSKYLPLDEADIIVSGGRGLRDDADMKLLEDLADTMGAAVGISLGALDSDVGSKEILIGLTGSNVSPSLYIACGISGASQHMAGIRGAKRIMAVNSDPNAPMMRIADYAVIGNLYDILPALTARFSGSE